MVDLVLGSGFAEDLSTGRWRRWGAPEKILDGAESRLMLEEEEEELSRPIWEQVCARSTSGDCFTSICTGNA